MNWRYTPVGRKYDFNAWTDLPRPVAERLVDEDAEQMKRMGVNTIRLIDETGDARWLVDRFYEQHGIRTIVNHFAGRYGATVGGAWVYPVDYSDPATRDAIVASAAVTVAAYRGNPAVVAYAFGNEGNYGLEWLDAAVQQLPEGERQAAKARHLYTLLDAVCRQSKQIDADKPTLIVNGEVQYLDLIAELCPSADVVGVNAYRGPGFGDLFDRVAEVTGRPALLIEFGADAYDAAADAEDGAMQANVIDSILADLRANARGGDPSHAGAALGGCLFQWVDEWWKAGNDVDLDTHETLAGWANGGYPDFRQGANNMNEEWWGLNALSPTPDAGGLHERLPRPACDVVARHWGDE